MRTSKPRPEIRCQICGKLKAAAEVMPAELVRPGVVDVIREAQPEWSPAGYICLTDLNHFRTRYVQHVLETERGELSTLEDDVVRSLREHEVLAANADEEYSRSVTFGQRLADRIAEFGGSWRFILIFAAVLVIWITINSLILFYRPFDPYPFILLNLILSCLAAVQAPVIMMSQNRQEAKDRVRAEHEYRVNLKAELEIRHLHSKLDLLLSHQWQRLIEIQELQMELLEEVVKPENRKRGTRSEDGQA
jgi:uncharacterized membrane protein